MRKLLPRLVCLMLALAFAAALPALAAAPGNKVVRVGWYESAFHRTDAFGRRSGYGYEYQQRVATFTGWTYEYVEGSWSDLYEKLVAGEIDLLSDVSYTPERAEKIAYSALGMGSEGYHAFIAPTNTEISPDDFSTFNGKRVGVNKNSIQEQLFIDWAESHGVTPEIVELTGKSPELFAMLDAGEIDVLVTLDAYGRSAGAVSVCDVGASDFYFGINKSRPDIKRELDVAMNRILEENRYFNQQLAEKYDNNQTVNGFLSADEKRWLGDHGTLRVGYKDGLMPFCGQDENGALTGMLADFLEFAETCEKNATLSFEARPFDTVEAGLKALNDGEIDFMFPVCMSAYDGEQKGVIVTDPLVSTEIYAAVRTEDHLGVSAEREMTAAIIEGSPNYETFLMDSFPGWRSAVYSDSESAFKAVASGEADCVLISSYRLNRVGALCTQYKLSTLTTGAAMNLAFAVGREADCLFSTLNKIGRFIPEATLSASLSNHSFTAERVTFRQFLRDNLAVVVAAASSVVILMLVLLLLNVRANMKASERRRLISETERDRLTNLYNRDFFFVYANRLHREHPDKPMDAIVVNIDRFHTVNTLNGRTFGDEVLRALAAEIDRFLSETVGIAGRIEGDHFDIYCTHLEDPRALLDRLQARLSAAYRNADIRLRMGVMPWQAGIDPEHMFDRAWLACNLVRGDFKARCMVYDEAIRLRDERDRRLQNDLTRALDQRELQVYYQPKYDIQSEPPRLMSAEALIRWNHPELGLIQPADFIPLFEQSGQISAVDSYVWAEAARQIAAWRVRLGATLRVSVNLSRVDVFDPGLSDTLDALIEKYGLRRGDLTLEVTESAYTENADHLIWVIEHLRKKGYEIEMDDFGSGYSSLNMLSSMPIDVLKMDMKFVQNIESSARDMRLVKLILDIAKNLNLKVVAEGVETEGQLKLLRDAGCDLVQGYYFSKPLPPGEFEEKILGPGFGKK